MAGVKHETITELAARVRSHLDKFPKDITLWKRMDGLAKVSLGDVQRLAEAALKREAMETLAEWGCDDDDEED